MHNPQPRAQLLPAYNAISIYVTQYTMLFCELTKPLPTSLRSQQRSNDALAHAIVYPVDLKF